MKKKILMITHMGQMIAQFNKDNIKILQDLGYEVHLAANFKSKHNTMTVEQLHIFCENMRAINVIVHQVDFERGIGTIKSNLKVWKQLKQIEKANKFTLIHCQSPLGGVFGRLLGRKFKIKVIYTAHGFHFFTGSPKLNWIVYYPIEKWLSKYTNTLIVINSEDFEVAKHFRKNLSVVKIPGIGIDWEGINNEAKKADKSAIRNELKIPMDALLLVSVGELSDRKNQEVIIKAIAELSNEKIYYLIIGIGSNLSKLQKTARELKVIDRVKFVGYREDVPQLLGASDVSVFPSKREGLGLAGIESMAAGLPLIASNINGILEYAVDGKSGFLCDPDDATEFAKAIDEIKNVDFEKIINFNLNRSKKFDKKYSHEIMYKEYKKYM